MIASLVALGGVGVMLAGSSWDGASSARRWPLA